MRYIIDILLSYGVILIVMLAVGWSVVEVYFYLLQRRDQREYDEFIRSEIARLSDVTAPHKD